MKYMIPPNHEEMKDSKRKVAVSWFSRLRLPVVFVLLFGACNDLNDFSIPELENLSLYWDHQVFGNEGRRYRFSFMAQNQFDDQHQLIFEPSVEGTVITFNMVRSINQGECPKFPMPVLPPNDPHRCSAEGRTFIQENQLPPGDYTVRVITPFFRETAELRVGQESAELSIKPNPYFKSAIEKVYPLPKDLLFGSVVDSGDEKLELGRAFIRELENLGLTQATLPPSPYRHLMLDDNDQAPEKFWDSGEFSLGIAYNLHVDFEKVVEVATRYFEQSALNISVYTSNGDEGFFRPQTGINVIYAGRIQ